MPNGKLQLMVDSDGVPKVLKLVLEECGERGHGESLIRLPGFYRGTACCVHLSYLSHEISFYIFAQAKYIYAFHIWWRRQQHLKLPCNMQFHPELNPIERGAGRRQSSMHAPHCDYTFSSLQWIAEQALDSIALEQVCKHFRKVRDYHRAYMPGKSALEAETNVLDDMWVKTVLEHPQVMCFTQSLGQSHLAHLVLHT